MSPFSLEGKIVLVTGASRGIGAAIATTMALAGAKVVAANRTVTAARELASSLTARGLAVSATEFIANRAGCDAAVAATARQYGGLDILVHNAGGCRWTALADMTDEILEEALALNLKCCFWLTQAATPWLAKSGAGRVLITSSVTGPRVVMADSTHYAAAKAGVNGFIRAAALELSPLKITVNGVEPGFIGKDRGRLSQEDNRARIEHYIPVGHMGSADDIAHAMLYLASPGAAFVTGQTLVVDGGATLPDSGFAMDDLRGKSGGIA